MRIKPLLLMLFALAMSGCASAPVQEMSDARQAIAAAERNPAARNSTQLKSAKQALADAERALQQRLFRLAGNEARQAKQLALQAQAMVP